MKSSHFNKKLIAVSILATSSLLSTNANATLIDLPSLETPTVVFDNTGTTVYDANTGILLTDALPIATQFSLTAFPSFVNPGAFGESVSIGVQLDTQGNLIGGVEGDDLVIIGEIDTDRDGTADYSGTLLTAEVLEFGFQDDGFNDLYNYTFVVTGGALATEYPTGNIGLTIVSEGSSFTTFEASFTGASKGTIGSIPTIPPQVTECKIDVLGTCTVQVPPTQPSCDAKIAASTFKYTGPTLYAATVEFIGKSEGYASYTTDLISGETVLTSPEQNGYTVDGRPGDLGSKLSVYINGEEEILHTSCSVPYTVGQAAPVNGGDSKGSHDKGSKGSKKKGSKNSKGSHDKGSKNAKGFHNKGSHDNESSSSVSENWTVVAFVDKEGDVVETTTQTGLTCSIPANSTNPVLFGFELTNSGDSTIDTADVLDSFGVVPGSPVGILNPGESITLERSELILAETENVVSVTGTAGPLSCSNLTAVTIHVEEPADYCPPSKGSHNKGSHDSKGSHDKGSKDKGSKHK